MAEQGSMLNTPPTYAIYMAGLCMKWLKKQGGVEGIEPVNIEKARLLYDAAGRKQLLPPDGAAELAQPHERDLHHRPTRTRTRCSSKQAAARGLVNLKGHRLVGGIRASIYNAMPIEGVRALIAFMKDFEQENK